MSAETVSEHTRPPASRSPLYEAAHAPRYERQALIRKYQDNYECRLVVLIGPIFASSVTFFEETLYDADPGQDLHVMLATPGGDGETALRLVRQAKSRCKKLTVIVPDMAKSAGTLFVLGADQIYMGPTSDLGPVDPQFPLANGSLAAGKTIIAAVEEAERRVQANPETYTLHASLLSDVTALMVQQARDAIARTEVVLKEALACVKDRSADKVESLAKKLRKRLIETHQIHGATVSATDAKKLGLPVTCAKPGEKQWHDIWRMWTKYVVINPASVYEGQFASHIKLPRTSS